MILTLKFVYDLGRKRLELNWSLNTYFQPLFCYLVIFLPLVLLALLSVLFYPQSHETTAILLFSGTLLLSYSFSHTIGHLLTHLPKTHAKRQLRALFHYRYPIFAHFTRTRRKITGRPHGPPNPWGGQGVPPKGGPPGGVVIPLGITYDFEDKRTIARLLVVRQHY